MAETCSARSSLTTLPRSSSGPAQTSAPQHYKHSSAFPPVELSQGTHSFHYFRKSIRVASSPLWVWLLAPHYKLELFTHSLLIRSTLIYGDDFRCQKGLQAPSRNFALPQTGSQKACVDLGGFHQGPFARPTIDHRSSPKQYISSFVILNRGWRSIKYRRHSRSFLFTGLTCFISLSRRICPAGVSSRWLLFKASRCTSCSLSFASN